MCYVTHNNKRDTSNRQDVGRRRKNSVQKVVITTCLKTTKGGKKNNNLLEQVVVITIDVLRVEQSLQSLSNGFYRTGLLQKVGLQYYLQLPLYPVLLIQAIMKRVSCKMYLLRLFDEMFDFLEKTIRDYKRRWGNSTK
ncbi:Uncharacterized protein APZ42_015321 [Daphnia magna]|uniref:Uncharacterized protein n=1 Tax=Daphnia magna TaxID=35525 RepID=A0A162PD47_9CRUS|nr:Uncharacterized protein APZ42_015321 [Daphnia magna]